MKVGDWLAVGFLKMPNGMFRADDIVVYTEPGGPAETTREIAFKNADPNPEASPELRGKSLFEIMALRRAS